MVCSLGSVQVCLQWMPDVCTSALSKLVAPVASQISVWIADVSVQPLNRCSSKRWIQLLPFLLQYQFLSVLFLLCHWQNFIGTTHYRSRKMCFQLRWDPMSTSIYCGCTFTAESDSCWKLKSDWASVICWCYRGDISFCQSTVAICSLLFVNEQHPRIIITVKHNHLLLIAHVTQFS